MIEARYRKAIDEFVRRAIEEYGDMVESIILFGSVARGEAKEDSDIDILVVWNGKKAEGWRAMTRLAFDVLLDTGEHISVKILGSEDVQQKTPFIRNVMREGIKIA
ncbi:nucleotidyltransferase domain-containing protein [Geoglobus acetivorans]|uniref:Nucleotidyltransferase domain-containing protein n=1 Tax=Geoglobus acetivorans TaxID=565033 RepID=A0ABZ3H532_GEOAI|nr:nucleotidyltransferase domain-containing protein [Geoglobus acetivorans]